MKRQMIDQTAHFVWAFMALLPVMLWPGLWGGALAGFLLAAPREFWDQRPPGRFRIKLGRSRVLDLVFFIAGGALAGFFFGV